MVEIIQGEDNLFRCEVQTPALILQPFVDATSRPEALRLLIGRKIAAVSLELICNPDNLLSYSLHTNRDTLRKKRKDPCHTEEDFDETEFGPVNAFGTQFYVSPVGVRGELQISVLKHPSSESLIVERRELEAFFPELSGGSLTEASFAQVHEALHWAGSTGYAFLPASK